MENKKKVLRKTPLGFFAVEPDSTPEKSIGYYASPGGSLDLDRTPEEALVNVPPGSKVYRIVAEPVL